MDQAWFERFLCSSDNEWAFIFRTRSGELSLDQSGSLSENLVSYMLGDTRKSSEFLGCDWRWETKAKPLCLRRALLAPQTSWTWFGKSYIKRGRINQIPHVILLVFLLTYGFDYTTLKYHRVHFIYHQTTLQPEPNFPEYYQLEKSLNKCFLHTYILLDVVKTIINCTLLEYILQFFFSNHFTSFVPMIHKILFKLEC